MANARGVNDTAWVSLVAQSQSSNVALQASPEGHLEVEVHGPATAFGEISTAEKTPVIENSFIYGLNSELLTLVTQGSGTITETGSLATAATAAGANSMASLRSKRIIKYKPGIGAEGDFTAMWNAAAAADPVGASTTAGIGTAESFLGFGYVGGAGFSIIHNETATREIVTCTITTKSSNSQTAVVTLAGVAYNVAVTNGADVNQTAWEIATGVDYLATFPGWTASATGAVVTFVCATAGDQTGSFSISFPTSGAGTFATVVNGATGTTTLVPQASWNVDTMLGTGGSSNPSGMLLNTQKLNVFRISYQFLGAGSIFFYVEDSESGEMEMVHRIKRPNSSLTPSLRNPGGPIQFTARNTTNTTAVAVSVASLGGFIQGKRLQLGVKRAYSASKTGIGTTTTPLFSLRAAQVFNDKVSTVEILPVFFQASNLTAGRAAIIDVYENPALTPYANFSAVSMTTSVARISTVATGITGGTLKASITINGGTSAALNLESLQLQIAPGSWLTFTCRADSATVSVSYSLTWNEEQ